jgi:hypothetical protein
MKTRGKALLFTAAMTVGTCTYGSVRFHAAKQSPQCDHLPGVCIYGERNPDSAAVRIQRGGNGTLIRTLELCYGSRCSSVTATYENREAKAPRSVGLGQLDRQICGFDSPAQLVLSPRNTIVARRCWGGVNFPRDVDHLKQQLWDFVAPRDPERYLAPYMGIREIFRMPRPIELPCAAGPEPQIPTICETGRHADSRGAAAPVQSEELACGMEIRLLGLAQGESGFRRCRLQQARRELIEAINDTRPGASESRLREQTELSNITIGDLHNAGGQDVKTFWRGWDALFGLAFLGACFYAMRKAYLKVKNYFARKTKPSG